MKNVVAYNYRDIDFSRAKRGAVVKPEPGKRKNLHPAGQPRARVLSDSRGHGRWRKLPDPHQRRLARVCPPVKINRPEVLRTSIVRWQRVFLHGETFRSAASPARPLGCWGRMTDDAVRSEILSDRLAHDVRCKPRHTPLRHATRAEDAASEGKQTPPNYRPPVQAAKPNVPALTRDRVSSNRGSQLERRVISSNALRFFNINFSF